MSPTSISYDSLRETVTNCGTCIELDTDLEISLAMNFKDDLSRKTAKDFKECLKFLFSGKIFWKVSHTV